MLLAIVMVVGLVPGFTPAASAATTGTTGEVNWSFDETTGTLTVSGTGAMADYTSGSQPWYAYKDSITTVIVEKGVTTISTNAFSQFPVLKTVKIAGSVTAIGNNAFYSCSNLTTVEYYGSSAPQASSNVFFGVYAVVKVLTTYEGNVFCGKMARATLDAANEPVSSAPDETPPAAPTPHNASGTIYVFECSNTGLSHQSIGIAFDSNYSKAGEPFKNADGEWIVEVTNNVKAMWEDHMSGIYENIYPDNAHTPRVELPEELTVTLTWDPEVGMWKYDKDYVYYDISCEPLTATYTVTVTDDGNGTASANPASGAECTEVSLTATPNEGYQFKEWQVLSGDVIVTDDTFTIGTANVEIKAVFEEAAPAVDYSLWIGGTRVTSLNASDVFGDGKVSYDPESNTLTLNNYSYEGEYIWSDGPTQGAAIRYEGTDTLKLVLNGESSVTYSGRKRDACYGLYSKKSLVISGDGALTATATPDYGSGVYVVNGGITVESGSLTGTATGDIAVFGVYTFRGDITVKGGTLTGTASDKTRGIGVCASNSNITVESGSLTGTGYFYGIDADAITVNGGTVEATGGSQAFYVEPTIAKTLAVYDAEDQVIENPVWTGIGALTYAKIAEKPSFSVSLSIGTAYTNTTTDFYRGDNGTMYCTFTFPDGVPAGRMHLYVNGEKKNASFNVTADSSSTTLKKTRSTATNLKNGENVVKFEFVPSGSTESYFTNEITVTLYKIDAARVAKHLSGDTDTTVDYDGTPKTVAITSLYVEGGNTLYLAPEQYTVTYWQGDQQIEEPTLPGVYDVKITVPENDYYAQVTNHKLCTLTINAPATHSVYVSAVDAADGWELAGAHLQILNTAGDVIVIDGNEVEWDSTMEAKKIEGLKTDTAYTLRATVAPDGYTIASDTTFRIDAEGNVTSNGTVDAYGTILVKFDPTVVQFLAVDDASGEAIAGATMQILDEEGYVVDEWVSTEDSHEITGLKTGVAYTLCAAAAPEGHTASGDTQFAIHADGTVIYTDDMTNDDVLLFKFVEATYDVTITQPTGGEAETDKENPAAGEEVTITVTPDEGKEVDMVTVTDQDGNSVDVTDNGDGTYTYEQPAGNVTITVELKNKRFTVIWSNGNGGSYEQNVKYGDAVTVPNNEFFHDTMRRTGYTLTGWDQEIPKTMPAHDLTFTAQYTANTYTVSFDANGGAAIDPITVTYGEKYGNLPSSAITGLSGGSKSWYLVDENGNVTDTNIKNLTKVETARDHTLFIKRAVLAPTVKIALEVPGAISNDYQYYVPGNSTRVLTATVSNENKDVLDYTYQWYKDGEAIDGATEAVLTLDGNVSDTGTYKVVVTATLKADSDIVVTANSASAEKEQAVKILHAANTLSYDANGGENAPGSHYTGGETITVESDEPSREHYTFAGWNTKADGSGSSYSAGSTYTFAEDNGNGGCEVTLYAQWTANTYAVTLETNRGTIREGNVTEYAYGVGAKLPTAVTRPGCRFVGWYDNEAFKGDPVTEITTTDHGDKTFYAKWKKTSSGASEPIYIPENDGHRDCPLYSYVDLNWNGWYHDGIHFCLEEGLMNGISATRFAPDSITTRAMIVTILWRLEGAPMVNDRMDFSDVSDDMWYTEAIRWAASEDIAEGYGDIFGPNDPITREQMAAIMWRYAKYKGYDVSVGEDTNILSYDDAFDVSDWAIPAMQWACGAGLINGVEIGNAVYLKPADNTTRAQAAAILQRFCEKELGK